MMAKKKLWVAFCSVLVFLGVRGLCHMQRQYSGLEEVPETVIAQFGLWIVLFLGGLVGLLAPRQK